MDHIRFDQPVIFDLIYSRIRIYANRIYAKTGYMQRLFWLPLLYFALFCIRLYAKTGYMQKFRWLPSVCIYVDSTALRQRWLHAIGHTEETVVSQVRYCFVAIEKAVRFVSWINAT